MKERIQKILYQVNDCPQRDRSETEWYGGVQTFMWICADNIIVVPFDKEHLFGQILSPSNQQNMEIMMQRYAWSTIWLRTIRLAILQDAIPMPILLIITRCKTARSI